MRLNIKVRTNSGKKEVIKIDDENYEVYLKSNPENNKANIELIKLLSKYFNSEVKIISGKTSKKKVVDVKDE